LPPRRRSLRLHMRKVMVAVVEEATVVGIRIRLPWSGRRSDSH
jgi:hypothetical protein